MNKDGRAQAVRFGRRTPVHDRWSGGARRWVKGARWYRHTENEMPDGEIPEGVEAQDAETQNNNSAKATEPIIIKTKEFRRKAFQIRKSDAEKHWFTRVRAGCSS